LFNTYWDKEIVATKYIISDTKDMPSEAGGFQFIRANSNPKKSARNWSNKVLSALNLVQTKHVLWLQDDYFFTRTIQKEMFDFYFYLLEQYKANKLAIHWPYTELKLTPLIPEFHIYRMNQDSPFTNTLQSAIWRTDFFRTALRQNETPWEFEIIGSQRTNLLPHTILLHEIQENWYHEVMHGGVLHPKHKKILEAHDRSDLVNSLALASKNPLDNGRGV
jgi:hypothetical protein